MRVGVGSEGVEKHPSRVDYSESSSAKISDASKQKKRQAKVPLPALNSNGMHAFMTEAL